MHASLERGSRARQAKWHADIAVGVASTPTAAGGPEELLRSSSVEARDVDADAQLAGLHPEQQLH